MIDHFSTIVRVEKNSAFFPIGIVFCFLLTAGTSWSAEGDRHWRFDVGGGAQTFNYTSTAPLFYGQLVYNQPKKFYLLGRFDYIDKFGDQGFSTSLGGGYFVHPKILLSDTVTFAPPNSVVPEFQNVFEVLGVLPHGVTPYLRYGFRLFDVADIHLITPGLSWYFSSWGIFDANYTLSITDIDGLPSGRTTDNTFSFRVTLIPVEDRLKFFAGYARSSESFDAGNVVNPIGRFHANVASFGAEWAFLKNFGVRFDTIYENRDNGQTVHTYEGGVFYRF